MKNSHDIFLGIDLGTSTIKAVVARILPDNTLEFLGNGEMPSLSMLKGEPDQPGIVIEQIFRAIQEAIRTAALREFPNRIALALSGGYMETKSVSVSIDIPNSLPITEADCIAAGRSVYGKLQPAPGQPSIVPPGKFPLSTVVTRNFRLADGRMFFSPIGQISSTLTCETLYFALDYERYNRIVAMLNTALDGRHIDYTVPVPLAISAALCPPLTVEDNLPLPLLIDLGAGVTSLSMPTPGGYLIAEQLGIGCDHLANDVNLVFGINNIKTTRNLIRELANYRCTAVAAHDGDARMLTIGFPNGTTMDLSANDLETVIEVRLKELFQIIAQRLEANQAYGWLDNEIILSGDGALIPRICELVSGILHRKVRVGSPYQVDATRFFDTLPPRYTTICGLLRAALRMQMLKEEKEQQGTVLDRVGRGLRDVWQAIFEW